MLLCVLQKGVWFRKVCANLAHGINETKGITKATYSFIKTQPNNDGYQLQNTYGVAGETLLLDHYIRTA
jgi:outer membrane cobalamin receptor